MWKTGQQFTARIFPTLKFIWSAVITAIVVNLASSELYEENPHVPWIFTHWRPIVFGLLILSIFSCWSWRAHYTRSRVPPIDDFPLPEKSYHIDQIEDDNDIRSIAQKASELYQGASLTADVKLGWYKKNPKGFWVIKDEHENPVGSCEILALKLGALTKLQEEEKDITSEDIYSAEEAKNIQELYIENVMAIDPETNISDRHPAAFLATQFHRIVDALGVDPKKTKLYSMPLGAYFSLEGKRNANSAKTMSSLCFKKIGKTRQGHPFYCADLDQVLRRLKERLSPQGKDASLPQ